MGGSGDRRIHPPGEGSPEVQAIETVYKHTRFRSRLEARWAAFFERIGWQWTYEPFDAAGYIPDFLIAGRLPLLVEIKPAVTEHDYRQHTGRLELALSDVWELRDVLVLGADPQPGAFEQQGWDDVAGMLGEPGVLSDPWEERPSTRVWGAGVWTRCIACDGIRVHHAEMSFACRPCGHGVGGGDGYLGTIDPGSITRFWREAGNDVRWEPRGR